MHCVRRFDELRSGLFDGRDGVVGRAPDRLSEDLQPLFEAIVDEIPPPAFDPEAPFQMLVSDLGFSDYLGRLAIGKVFNGQARARDSLVCVGASGDAISLKISKLQVFDGMQLAEKETVEAGEIVVLAGLDEVKIGDTICNQQNPRALPRIRVFPAGEY